MEIENLGKTFYRGLNERQRGRFTALEAKILGFGGIKAVHVTPTTRTHFSQNELRGFALLTESVHPAWAHYKRTDSVRKTKRRRSPV